MLNKQQRAFARELCYGTCRWYPQLSEVLTLLISKALRKKDTDIHAILLTGLYQLAYLRIAHHAAIHESVQLTLNYRKPWAKKLVNAVLRRFQRDSEQLLSLAEVRNPGAHPLWLVHRLETAWPGKVQALLSANNLRPPMTLRINRQKTSRQRYLRRLQLRSIAATRSTFSADGIYLESPLAVESLPGFAEGEVSVQDEAPQLAAELLALEPEQRVLDACAAPGGKACHMAELVPQIHLTALDIEAKRLLKITENTQRLGIQAEVVCGDAAQPTDWWDGQLFDRILMDAPCSATGIIRRQPDIKLLRRAEHIEALKQRQLNILQALWPLLKEGGILLYATCSVLPEENHLLIEQFMAQHTDAQESVMAVDWGEQQAHGRQLFPRENSHDGFYYCRLVKKRSY